MRGPPKRSEAEALEVLRQIPFVKALRYNANPPAHDKGYDGKLTIQTRSGSVDLVVEVKRSYLSRASVNRLAAWINSLRERDRRPLILLARYIPRPTGQELIEHHVNFVDRAGNVHLELGPSYNWTILGLPEKKPILESHAVTAAQVQLLFQFVTDPGSIHWPVRRLESVTGISKSNAAKVRAQLTKQGLLNRQNGKYHLGPPTLVTEQLISGYSQILRPKLMLGRFTYPEKTPESFLDRLAMEAGPNTRYALTGGPAANLLQHYYRPTEVPFFLTPWDRTTVQRLRLMPDREGPVQILRAFGEVVFWRKEQNHTVAPP